MFKLKAILGICAMFFFSISMVQANEVLPVLKMQETAINVGDNEAPLPVKGIDLVGRKKVVSANVVRCPGKKPKCLSATHVSGEDPNAAIINTYNEYGEVDGSFLVSSYEVVDTVEDGEPVTYFYFELADE